MPATSRPLVTPAPPALASARLAAHAEAVRGDLCAQEGRWANGSTRRRFLAGAGLVGAAALGSQLVTTRAAYAADPVATGGNTLVVVFLRGGADGLRALVPAASSLGLDHLTSVRPGLLPPTSSLLPLAGAGGWAVNGALRPLLPFWGSGELTFVPAVSTSPSRSHFDSQRFLETGGAPTAAGGWLDRLLTVLGPGTTFRALAEGYTTPASMVGVEQKIVTASLAGFTVPAWKGYEARTSTAINGLYRGLTGSLPADVATALSAVATAASARAVAAPQNGAVYPANDAFASALSDIAGVLRAEVGLQVATVDVGGWDTHTDEATDLDAHLGAVATSLAAFLTDLGPTRRSRVTVVVMSEFGRRVAQNGSAGADHGFGGLMWLLGGGLVGAQVAGRWTPLSAAVLDQGDVPGLNSPFDVLGELATTRLGAGSLSTVFPGVTTRPIGVAHR